MKSPVITNPVLMNHIEAPAFHNLEQLQKVIDSSIDMISVTDADGRYTFASAASESITGYKPEELLGRRFIDFVFGEDKQKTLAAERAVMAGKRLINFNNRYVKKDGSLVPLAWSAHWDDARKVMYCVARDSSELLEAQQKLELSEQRFKNLVEGGYDLMAIINNEGLYQYVSPSVQNILGYAPQQLIGANTFPLIHEEDLDYIKSVFHSLVSGETEKFITRPFRFKSADGKWLWLETVAINKMNDSSVRGIVANSRNVTERIHSEKLLSQSEKQYRFLFENNPLAMMAFEIKSGRFVMVNDAALRQYGYDREAFLLLNIKDIRPAEDLNKYIAFVNNTERTNIVFAGHWRHKKKDGSLMDVEIISHEIVLNGVNCRMAVAIDVTEKLRASRRLEESEATLRIIGENYPNGVILILDENLEVSYIAGQELQRLNLLPEAFLHKSYRAVFPEDITKKLDEQVEKVKHGNPVVFELAYNEDHYLFSAVPYREHDVTRRIIVAIQNITAQHNALNRIYIQSDILENVTNFILATDNNYKITYYNKEAIQLFGECLLTQPNLILFDITSSRFNGAIKEILDHLSGTSSAEMEVVLEGNEERWLNMRLSIMRNSDKEPIGYLCMGKDITARKRNDVERELLIHELDSTVKDLRQFSYITSHNLRSPIANLLGITSIIEDEKVEDEFTKLLIQKIKDSTVQLNETVNDLMSVLLIKNNVNTPVEKLSLSTTWNHVCRSIERLIKDAGARINADFSGGDVAVFNRSYLESVMLNLLTNAIKYRSPNRKLTVHIKTYDLDDFMVLQFCDNGLGIDMQKYGSKVFGLYQRFHNHADSKGLGLYLVNSQVKALGGKIEIESEVDKGTCFQVFIKKLDS